MKRKVSNCDGETHVYPWEAMRTTPALVALRVDDRNDIALHILDPDEADALAAALVATAAEVRRMRSER